MVSMRKYNWQLDRDTLNLIRREQQINEVVSSSTRGQLNKDRAWHLAQSRYYDSEAGYHGTRLGALGTITQLAQSRIREIDTLRTAALQVNNAERAVTDATLLRETNRINAQLPLHTRRLADFRTLMTTGTALNARRRNVVQAARNVNTQQSGLLDAQQAALGARRGTTRMVRTRLAQTETRLRAQLAQARALQPFVGQVQQAERGVIQAETGLHFLAARQRRRERVAARDQAVGEIAASGAARGFVGSFQEVGTAQADQQLRRDLTRYRAEDAVELLKLGQRATLNDRAAVAEFGRLDVAEKRALEGIAQLGVERGELGERVAATGVEQARIDVGRARVWQAVKQADADEAQVNDAQAALQSRTDQGTQQVLIDRSLDLSARDSVLPAQRALAQRRQALGVAQYTASGEQSRRVGIEQRDSLRQASLAQARSRQAKARSLRDRDNIGLETYRLREQEGLQRIAAQITKWQIDNQPGESEYGTGSRQSELSNIFRGLAAIWG